MAVMVLQIDHREIVHSTSGSQILQRGLPVVGVERVESSPHDLHVLLRHRPRSIPQAQESA